MLFVRVIRAFTSLTSLKCVVGDLASASDVSEIDRWLWSAEVPPE